MAGKFSVVVHQFHRADFVGGDHPDLVTAAKVSTVFQKGAVEQRHIAFLLRGPSFQGPAGATRPMTAATSMPIGQRAEQVFARGAHPDEIVFSSSLPAPDAVAA